MFYVDTFVLPAVFLDGLARLESLLLAVLVLDGRHAKFLADFKRNEKCFGHKSFHLDDVVCRDARCHISCFCRNMFSLPRPGPTPL